jgi:ABC-type uncharacterized transport system permease subunit
LLVVQLRQERGHGLRWYPAAAMAVVLHSWRTRMTWRMAGGADLHFFAALSLVGLGMATMTTLYGATGRLAALGVVVFPIAAATLYAYAQYGHVTAEALDWRLQLHAWCALLAYATLAIAALLAITLWLQERALRRRDSTAGYGRCRRWWNSKACCSARSRWASSCSRPRC